jgi:hypothetical protein
VHVQVTSPVGRAGYYTKPQQPADPKVLTLDEHQDGQVTGFLALDLRATERHRAAVAIWSLSRYQRLSHVFGAAQVLELC